MLGFALFAILPVLQAASFMPPQQAANIPEPEVFLGRLGHIFGPYQTSLLNQLLGSHWLNWRYGQFVRSFNLQGIPHQDYDNPLEYPDDHELGELRKWLATEQGRKMQGLLDRLEQPAVFKIWQSKELTESTVYEHALLLWWLGELPADEVETFHSSSDRSFLAMLSNHYGKQWVENIQRLQYDLWRLRLSVAFPQAYQVGAQNIWFVCTATGIQVLIKHKINDDWKPIDERQSLQQVLASATDPSEETILGFIRKRAVVYGLGDGNAAMAAYLVALFLKTNASQDFDRLLTMVEGLAEKDKGFFLTQLLAGYTSSRARLVLQLKHLFDGKLFVPLCTILFWDCSKMSQQEQAYTVVDYMAAGHHKMIISQKEQVMELLKEVMADTSEERLNKLIELVFADEKLQ